MPPYILGEFISDAGMVGRAGPLQRVRMVHFMWGFVAVDVDSTQSMSTFGFLSLSPYK